MKEPKYETVYILRPDLTEDMVKKANDKISELIQKYKGQITQVRDLGRKQLAYPIAKHHKGHYFQLNFLGNGEVVHELERHLRVSEETIRFLTVAGDVPQAHLSAHPEVAQEVHS